MEDTTYLSARGGERRPQLDLPHHGNDAAYCFFFIRF